MVMHYPSLKDPLLSRRQVLSRMGAGFGGLGLATLLAESAQAETSPLTMRGTPLCTQSQAGSYNYSCWRPVPGGHL